MVRLYDLDGNFEKITKWMIGENEKWSLFEGSYCEPMAPRKFDITQWEKAEAPNKFIDRFLSK